MTKYSLEAKQADYFDEQWWPNETCSWLAMLAMLEDNDVFLQIWNKNRR